ncbi:hypothetical protein FOA52_001482 [Chlamydomonas sp. UWO 241]|nr:hypothetical protein FOA52_001482 [Chlamydomonas sp. UWO 241]
MPFWWRLAGRGLAWRGNWARGWCLPEMRAWWQARALSRQKKTQGRRQRQRQARVLLQTQGARLVTGNDYGHPRKRPAP